MNIKRPKRLLLDFAMLLLILLEFAYSLTGSTLHELIGFLLFGLLIIHGKLNLQWFLTLQKGKYNAVRRLNVTTGLLLLVLAFLMLISGVLNSNILFSVLGMEFELISRKVHTAAAYWFLILMAFHLGLHWKMIMSNVKGMAGLSTASYWRTTILRLICAFIAVYGFYIFYERNILTKLIAYYSFDYWDFNDAVITFFIQYLAIVGLFACLGHYALLMIKSHQCVKKERISFSQYDK